jgi:nucleoside-diphosphate-sugar epimerase
MLKDKKIIITGGSGYLGRHVRRFFAADDLSRRAGGDICNDEDARRIADYDVVIHMAALVDKSPAAAARVFAVNVDGTRKLLEHLRAGQTFIFCSTKDVYGHHIDQYQQVPESCSTEYCGQGAYEWSKLIGEKYLQFHAAQVGARAAIFRLSTVYGPAGAGNAGGFVSFFARAIANGEPLKLKMNGQQIRDLLHVDDLSRAFQRFMESDLSQACYNIGGGPDNAVTLYQLTEILARLTGRAANLSLSDEAVREQVHYVTNIDALRRDLDWRPQLNIEDGLKTLLRAEA